MDRWKKGKQRRRTREEKKETRDYNRMKAFAIFMMQGGSVFLAKSKKAAVMSDAELEKLAKLPVKFSKTFPGKNTILEIPTIMER